MSISVAACDAGQTWIDPPGRTYVIPVSLTVHRNSKPFSSSLHPLQAPGVNEGRFHVVSFFFSGTDQSKQEKRQRRNEDHIACVEEDEDEQHHHYHCHVPTDDICRCFVLRR